MVVILRSLRLRSRETLRRRISPRICRFMRLFVSSASRFTMATPHLHCGEGLTWSRPVRRKRLYAFVAFVLFPLALACSSCTTLRLPTSRVPSATPSAQELLSTLEARRQALTSLRGLARVVYKDTNDKGTA